MRLDYLQTTHPTYTPDLWRRYDALYTGGDAFRQHITAFLPKNPEEPAEVYRVRCEDAAYIGYAGTICAWFSAKIAAASFTPRAKRDGDEVDADPFYAEFREDCDGAGTDLVDFIRERFDSALVKGRSWWCAEMPYAGDEPLPNKAAYDALDLGRATIYPVENEQVLDWQADRAGELLWAVVYDIAMDRDSVGSKRSKITETWRVYDRAEVVTYSRTYDPTEPETRKAEEIDVPEVARRPHGFQRVPLVPLGFVGTRGVRVKLGAKGTMVAGRKLEGFWLMNRLADPQIAHFRRSAAMDWSLARTCYAMPVFELKDSNTPPVMGTGYYIMLQTGERANWMAPPTAHLGALSERISTIKDEIYRVGNQMAQGVDNNAAAVGRSGASKAADAASTDVCLKVYGAVCREPLERTYDLLSDGRGDGLDWSIEGLDVFNTADATLVVQNATAAALLNIPSATFKRELHKQTAAALLSGSNQHVRDTINREIDDGVEAEESMKVESMLAAADAEAAGAAPPVATAMGKPTATPEVAAAHAQKMAERETV